MGDADISIQGGPEAEFELPYVHNVLDILDEDLNFFQGLEQRILQTWSPQIKKYIYFRTFFVAMNFILLPLIIAVGMCHGIKAVVIDEELKDVLQITITFLFYLIGCLGALLYFGSMWTFYTLTLPPDSSATTESQKSEDDNGSNSSTSEVSAENASTDTLPELVEDDFQDSLFKKIFAPQNNSSSSSNLAAENYSPRDVSEWNERDELESKENDEERKVIPSQVDIGFKPQEAI